MKHQRWKLSLCTTASVKPLPVEFSRSGTFPAWRTPPTCCPSTGVTTKLLTSLRQCYIGVAIPPLSMRRPRRRNVSEVMFDTRVLPEKGEDVSHGDNNSCSYIVTERENRYYANIPAIYTGCCCQLQSGLPLSLQITSDWLHTTTICFMYLR